MTAEQLLGAVWGTLAPFLPLIGALILGVFIIAVIVNVIIFARVFHEFRSESRSTRRTRRW